MELIFKNKEKMTSKNYINLSLSIITLVILLIPHNLMSQTGYAGPNKTILKDSSVMIGGAGCTNCCYQWTPATGLSDPKISNPIANPTTTTTYSLKVIGANFSSTDVSQMKLTVEEGINDLTVIAKQCCWKKDQPITLDQFTIVTDPAGLEGTVTLTPTTVPANIFLAIPTANPTASLPVTFTGRGPNNSTKTNIVNISCVDEDAQGQVQAGMGEINLQEIAKAVDMVINNVAAVGGCQVTGGLTSNMSFSVGKLCCPEAGCIKDMYAYNGSINYDKGVSCDILLYGLPYCASVNARVSGSAGISLNLGNVKSTCDGVDACYSVGFTISVGGGLSLTVAGGKLLDASLMLIGTATTPPFEYCIVSGKTKRESNVCLKADVVGSYTVLGFITESVSFPVINQRCF
jgi:hypothetical protein